MRKYSLADYVFQFITVTMGVFIALLIDGLAERRDNDQLVESARQTIRRELENNKKDLERTLAGLPADQEAMLNAITFADNMLSSGKSKINELKLHYNLADQLTNSGWRTAERTGALGHMDYTEVQRYSSIYDFQELFIQQQRQIVMQVALAGAIFKGNFDVERPDRADLVTFRARVMDLRAAIDVQEKFGRKLIEDYDAALKP